MGRRKQQENNLAKLRTLLSNEPSRAIWKEVLDVAAKAEQEEWKETLEPWLLAHLDSSWSDEDRILLPGWVRLLNQGKRPQGLSLIASIQWGGKMSKPRLQKQLDEAVMPSLRRFECGFSSVSTSSLSYLLSMPAMQNLEILDISGNDIKTKGIRILLESSLLQRLKCLKLNAVKIGIKEADLFVELGHSDSLEELELRNCEITQEVWQRLAESSLIQSLRTLRFDNNRSFRIHRNQLNTDFLNVFEATSFHRLEHLNVRKNNMYRRRNRHISRRKCILNLVSPESLAPNLREFLW